MMYISYVSAEDYKDAPHKLTRAGWDYFVDLSEARTEFEIWRVFCAELYSPTMGTLREKFNVNYFNDMMVEFFGDHAGESFDIGIYPAARIRDLGCDVVLDFVNILHRTHRHGTASKMLSRTPPVSAEELAKALNNEGMRIFFIR
jgi:hypothetical protein